MNKKFLSSTLALSVLTSGLLWAGISSPVREAPDAVLKRHRGWAAKNLFDEEDRRAAFVANWNSMKANYGNTVDFQLRRQVIVLSEESAPLVYGSPAVSSRDVSLCRPELARIVKSVTRGCPNDRAKALAIMRYVRDLYQPTRHPQFGGREESLIHRGDGLCESLSRLMVGLCEIAGLPGRIVLHVIGGHLATEIWIEGRWAYIDPRSGVFFMKPGTNEFASAWDLKNHPGWLDNQPRTVRRERSPRWKYSVLMDQFRGQYFHPREVIGVVNYSLVDAPRYSFRERSWDEVTERGLWDKARLYGKAAERVFGREGEPGQRNVSER